MHTIKYTSTVALMFSFSNSQIEISLARFMIFPAAAAAAGEADIKTNKQCS